MTPSTDRASEARLAWPDVARGLSVTLIVVLHLWATHLIFWIGNQATVEVIVEIVAWTSPLRVPLFFFISGYLASRSLQRPWQTAWRGRVFSIAYLYLLWVAIIAAAVWVDNRVNGFATENVATMILRNVASPETHMWYLWALIVLFVGVWCTRGLPSWAVVVAAGLVSVAAPFFLEQPYRQVAAAALFFALGARLPGVTSWLTSRRSIWIFFAGTTAYIGSILLGPTGPYGLADPITSTIGVAATIAIIGAVAHRPWAALLRKVGTYTLPIFILNPLVFLLLNDVLRAAPDFASWLAEHPMGGFAYTVGVLVLTLAGSIGLKMGADRIGLGWLFAIPSRWAHFGVRTP